MSSDTSPLIPESAPSIAKAARFTPRLIALYLTLLAMLAGSLYGIFHYTKQLSVATDISNKRINLAGRQRALSQRMTKALLAYERDVAANAPSEAALGELKKFSGVFNSVLTGFDRGAKVPGTDGKEFFLPAVADAEERHI